LLYSGNKENRCGSEPPTDKEEEVKGATQIEGAAPRLKARQTSRARNYNVPYQQSHTAELDVYRDREAPRTTKYLRAIYNKFHCIIDDYLGGRVDNTNGMKALKVPDPKAH
jgi:hypothetical protein